ncbi:MAG: DNA-processing protein DprA [Patescibacteria group bacterium]|nr:DNA-processing protein DprA [Patescibacteria group bacterium]
MSTPSLAATADAVPRATPAPLLPAERPFCIGWTLLPITAAQRWRLREIFGTFQTAWEADEEQLRAAGLGPATTTAFLGLRARTDAEDVARHIQAAGISCCFFGATDYPLLLQRIHDPPPVLFYRGNLGNLGPTLAVVGTRRASDYGLQVTWDLSRPLAAAGVTIVSGLALGIDTEAHRAALDARGRTIAVLGCGIDDRTIYPPANRRLANTIAVSGGAVISEYPPQTVPLPFRFPQRNRIIAGLSLGTLVVEAPERSGALITARAAAEENREVLAVPGRITDVNAAGPLKLIAAGATPVYRYTDIAAALNLEYLAPPASHPADAAPATPEDTVLMQLREPHSRQELQRQCDLTPATLATALTMLEVQGKIRRLPSGKFYRADGL